MVNERLWDYMKLIYAQRNWTFDVKRQKSLHRKSLLRFLLSKALILKHEIRSYKKSQQYKQVS